MRVRVTDTDTGKTRVNIRLPLNLVGSGIKMGMRFVPEVDGLDPNAYPIDALRDLASAAQSGGAAEGAKAELYYSAFFIAYAADLKIGRVAPQKVDPNLFRNRKTIDALRVLTEMQKQQDAGKALSLFEPRNNHYQTLKRMLKAYTRVINEGFEWPVIGQGDSPRAGYGPGITLLMTSVPSGIEPAITAGVNLKDIFNLQD